jgi:hypothetical protein
MRYYGLYAWLSWVYANKIGDTDPETWRGFIRRAEALYALIAQQNGGETGVAGSLWAKRTLNAAKTDLLTFSDGADPGSTPAYLKQPWGAYGAAYAAQLFEVGILAKAKNHDIPVPSQNIGEPLARAFSEAIGPLATRYFNAIRRGNLSQKDLERLAPMAPSAIAQDSDEREWYERILFAKAGLERPHDLDRRRTLSLVLGLARQLREVPSADEVRWSLYADCLKDDRPVLYSGNELVLHRRRWWVYHANDLAHVCFETLLKFVLDLLEKHPAGTPLDSLIDEAVQKLLHSAPDNSTTWDSFMHRTSIAPNAWADKVGADSTLVSRLVKVRPAGVLCTESHAWDALRLLAVLHRRFLLAQDDVNADLGRFDRDLSRSLLTEIEYLVQHQHDTLTQMLTGLLKQRVIRRHLWVAVQKLRHQNDYTFLIDADEGRVRLRDKDGPVLTNPRLGPAITFLQDIHLLGQGGLTMLGKRVMRTL